MLAAEKGHNNICALLIDRGADVNLANEVSKCNPDIAFLCVSQPQPSRTASLTTLSSLSFRLSLIDGL